MEIKRIPLNDRKSVHHSRYLVLPQTSQCWAMKEVARELWRQGYDDQTPDRWLEWMNVARKVGVPLLTSAVRTLRDRFYGILNAMKYRVSNSSAESLNSKIRLLRITARGYRNKERFKLAVMFHYDGLNMEF